MRESNVQVAEAAIPSGMLTAMAAFRRTDTYRAHYEAYRNQAREAGKSEVQAREFAFRAASPLYWTHQPSKERGYKNAVIPDQDWRMLTDEVNRIARQRRSISEALRSRGLAVPVDSIGRFSYEWQNLGDSSNANVALHLRTKINEEQIDHTLDGTPIPVIFKDYHLDERELEASRASGVAPIDLSHLSEGAEKVAQAIETIMVSGDSNIVFRGNTLVGLTNSPNIQSQGAAGDWATATNVTTTVRNAINVMRTNNHFGPFVLFVPSDQFSEMEQPWSTQATEPVREVVSRAHASLEAIIEAPALTSGNPVLVEMQSRNVVMPVAQDIIPIQYDNPLNGGVTIRVMAVLTIAIKADATGQSGICEITGA